MPVITKVCNSPDVARFELDFAVTVSGMDIDIAAGTAKFIDEAGADKSLPLSAHSYTITPDATDKRIVRAFLLHDTVADTLSVHISDSLYADGVAGMTNWASPDRNVLCLWWTVVDANETDLANVDVRVTKVC